MIKMFSFCAYFVRLYSYNIGQDDLNKRPVSIVGRSPEKSVELVTLCRYKKHVLLLPRRVSCDKICLP